MTPEHFKEANIKMRAPEGWTDSDCGALPVCHVTVDINGQKVNGFVSCWRPNAQEMQDIAEGKPIFLTVLSGGMPPVNLQTKNPVFYIQNPDSLN